MTNFPSSMAGLAVGVAMCLFPSQVFAEEQNEFPGRRVGGGTRGQCAINPAAVVALIPESNLGVTHQESPVLYFAVPATSEPYQVTFSLFSEEDAIVPIYETALEAGEESELLGVQIPTNTLEVGEYYSWYFAAICDASNLSTSIVLDGWIQTVEVGADIATRVDTELAQVRAYQAADLWSDAIALTVELMATNPECEACQEQWFQLLTELGLERMIDDGVSVRLPQENE